MKRATRIVRALAPQLTRCSLFAALAALLAPLVLLLLVAATMPLPASLREDHRFDASVRVLDRHGKLLAEVRADDGARSRWVRLHDVGSDLRRALIAAEDQRFYVHPGVDPVAIARAALQNLWHRRVVSGASTLTQQLGRNLVRRPRTLRGKVKEMAVALRIEASLSKDQILESYLNLIDFGPSLRGVEAASLFYFDKPSRSLSLAEAATLAATPRSPSLYDPRRSPAALRTRRDHILDRMQKAGWASAEQVERAKGEAVTVHARATGWGAPHLVRGLLDGRAAQHMGPLAGRVSELHTTLDAELQREAQTAARSVVRALKDRNASAAAVLVLDNQSGEVLAWVGSHDFFDEPALGQNDGVIALRQPGSTLKPFVYATAIEHLGWTAASVLPDVEVHLPGKHGAYSPKNYDERFHGPVRLREALASSLNVPAVVAASLVGPARVLQRLRDLGMDTLTQDAEHYGAAIALGDGEVRLLDLANAYATLARGGTWLPVRTLRRALDGRGQPLPLPEVAPRQVMARTCAQVLLDVLADPHARRVSFGAGSVLDLPFPVAVKTGTSKGFRDNLTVGSTPRVTVAVWVGNFDGSPMQGVSGVAGAGPLFRIVMQAAAKLVPAGAFDLEPEQFERVDVCRLSGELVSSSCPHRHTEVFANGTAPVRTCSMHVTLAVDTRTGRRAGRGCHLDSVRPRVFEQVPPQYAAWARTAQRPLAPQEWLATCPPSPDEVERGTSASQQLRVVYPYPGAVFLKDPSMPSASEGLVLRAVAPDSVQRLRFVVDGREAANVGRPFEQVLQLSRGSHQVWAETGQGGRSETVGFEVR
ncbi:MAG: penicillin-binding protein 1C [Polyangiaceae bacterium]|nr:penicillin-binding protein 1C [Polyangiaceae bacterium]